MRGVSNARFAALHPTGECKHGVVHTWDEFSAMVEWANSNPKFRNWTMAELEAETGHQCWIEFYRECKARGEWEARVGK